MTERRTTLDREAERAQLVELRDRVRDHAADRVDSRPCRHCQAYWEALRKAAMRVFEGNGRLVKSLSLEPCDAADTFLGEKVIRFWARFVAAEDPGPYVRRSAQFFLIDLYRVQRRRREVPVDPPGSTVDRLPPPPELTPEERMDKHDALQSALIALDRDWNETMACPAHDLTSWCPGAHAKNRVADAVVRTAYRLTTDPLSTMPFDEERREFIEDLMRIVADGGRTRIRSRRDETEDSKTVRDRIRRRVSRDEGLCFDWWLHTAWRAVVQLPADYAGAAETVSVGRRPKPLAKLPSVVRAAGSPRIRLVEDVRCDGGKFTYYPKSSAVRLWRGGESGPGGVPERRFETEDVRRMLTVHRPDVAARLQDASERAS